MAPKKYSPKKTSPKRSPVRSAMRTAEYTLDEVDVQPSKQIFRVLNMLGYLFVLCALAAGIAWIYYVSQANAQDTLGDDNGLESVVTATTCFEGAVVGYLFYYVARHHFSKHY
jgi:hypothetical protein